MLESYQFSLKAQYANRVHSPRLAPLQALIRGRATGSQPIGQTDFSPMTCLDYSTFRIVRVKFPQIQYCRSRGVDRPSHEKAQMHFCSDAEVGQDRASGVDRVHEDATVWSLAIF